MEVGRLRKADGWPCIYSRRNSYCGAGRPREDRLFRKRPEKPLVIQAILISRLYSRLFLINQYPYACLYVPLLEFL